MNSVYCAHQGPAPDSRCRSLMEEHGLRQRDLLDVFGSRGIASEVTSGKRAISKAQAKKLAALFHVPADHRTGRAPACHFVKALSQQATNAGLG